MAGYASATGTDAGRHSARSAGSEETRRQPIKEQPATPPPIRHIAEKQKATSKNSKAPLDGPAPDLSYRVAPTHDSDLGDALVLDAPERLAALSPEDHAGGRFPRCRRGS